VGELAEDRRLKRRYPLTAWTDLTVTETGATRRGYISNISREGAGLYYLGTVGTSQAVTVTLHMLGPSGAEIVEMVRGDVIWENQWGGITIMGIKFDQPLGKSAPTILDRMTRADGDKGPQLRTRPTPPS
jgi:hypothetical protein